MIKINNERIDQMKIRCKNCYRVLNENEDYCTNCGEYSQEMAEYMKTGVRKVSNGDKLKTALIFFAFIAFLGTGVFSIGASIIQGEVGTTSSYDVLGKLITSMGLVVSLGIVFRKEIIGIFFKGNAFQTIGGISLGILASVSIILISTLTSYTKVIPNSLLGFIPSSNSLFEFIVLLFVLTLVSICEEYIYRHRLINFFDEDTMLNDVWTIILSVVISTLLSFAWFMALETLLMTLVINILMTILYIKTNRSLGINILIRVLIYAGVLLINYIV